MNRRERNKQKKKKARQERLRQEKHLRQLQPRGKEEAEPEDVDLDDLEELSGPTPVASSPFRTERILRTLAPGAVGQGDAKARAQELAYQAMEHPDNTESARLAREALRLDPDCMDALTTLAAVDARSADELLNRLREAVATGERALGADFFAQNRGRFWGILETRPYMRTRRGLADALRLTDRLDEAIGHYEAMLELSRNDNLGNRDPLLGCYLAAGNLEGARRLLKDYAEATLAVFAWGRVLERYLMGDLAGAASALEVARSKNRHVEAFLTAARPVPKEKVSSYQPGQESEALYAADCLLGAWQRHPEAVTWLKTGKPASGAAPEAGQPASGAGSAGPAGEGPAASLPEQPLADFFKGEPARKWLDKFLAGTDTEPIVRALDPALDVPGELMLKASVCCEMLVAAELVAAGRGRPSRHLPPPIAAWLLERDVLFSPGVVAMAAAAVRRVGEFSELRQLWDTVHLGQEWLRGVQELHSRLQE
jgi:hypothetical protein